MYAQFVHAEVHRDEGDRKSVRATENVGDAFAQMHDYSHIFNCQWDFKLLRFMRVLHTITFCPLCMPFLCHYTNIHIRGLF